MAGVSASAISASSILTVDHVIPLKSAHEFLQNNHMVHLAQRITNGKYDNYSHSIDLQLFIDGSCQYEEEHTDGEGMYFERTTKSMNGKWNIDQNNSQIRLFGTISETIFDDNGLHGIDGETECYEQEIIITMAELKDFNVYPNDFKINISMAKL
eukprot:258269_1